MKSPAFASLLVPLLVACGPGGLPSSPESAPDAAHRVGCDDAELTPVPDDWSEFDEAVTCELDGAKVAIYWHEGADGLAMECLVDLPSECESAMKTFIERSARG